MGPILFTLYTQSLSDIISQGKCHYHKFADDTSLHQSSALSDFHSLIHDIEQHVNSVGSWMTGNRLKLNNDKTEALVVGSCRRVSVLQNSHLRVGSHDISFKSHVKSLGVYADATLSMAKHINHISHSAYLEIRRISSVRHVLTRKATVQLMCSFLGVWTIATLYSLTSLLVKCTALKKFKIMQQKSFFTKANMSMLHHFSKSFTGSQAKKGYFSR